MKWLLAFVVLAVVGCSGEQADSTAAVTNSIGMEFKQIPAGTFMMGSNGKQAWDQEKPVHQVTLTRPFLLGVYEVTQEEYEKVTGSNPSNSAIGEQYPVDSVSWEDAIWFCRKLSELPAEKAAGRFYRLPTEAEWEYACRAGTTTEYSFGDDESQLGDYAWFRGNSGKSSHPVGEKKPNPWGLYDMHGNVDEWCQDFFGDYPDGSLTDPQGPSFGSGRVFRGGDSGRSSARFQMGGGAFIAGSDLGFRVVLTTDEAEANTSNKGARLLERDPDAEEVLNLLGHRVAYAYKYDGGVLCATIYQTDGQEILYSTGRSIPETWNLSDCQGRLLVTLTDDGQVRVAESVKMKSGAGISWTTKKQLEPYPVPNASGVTSHFLSHHYGGIMFDEYLFMELGWLEEEVDLDAETKNRIWWDISQSRDQVAKRYEENDLSKRSLESSRMMEIRPIAMGYGITYEQARAIFDEGQTAAWRTETPPE